MTDNKFELDPTIHFCQWLQEQGYVLSDRDVGLSISWTEFVHDIVPLFKEDRRKAFDKRLRRRTTRSTHA